MLLNSDNSQHFLWYFTVQYTNDLKKIETQKTCASTNNLYK